ncbi:MAG: hypothetical protein IT318_12585 [Anaerolineales bacterium]|nr:hypothetical protein [Anaerolineales bacterium]
MVDTLLTNPLLLFVVAARGYPLGRLRLLGMLGSATALTAGVAWAPGLAPASGAATGRPWIGYRPVAKIVLAQALLSAGGA